MTTRSRSRWSILSLLALLVVAAGLLVRVSVAKRSAESSWNELYERATYAHPGMYVPPYEAVTARGDLVTLGEGAPGTRQLLYFFTTTCPYCRASVPSWNDLARLTRSRPELEVYGVAVDTSSRLSAYVAGHGLSYPVVRMTEPRYARLYRGAAVPLTMVVEADGRVTYARRGEFSTEALADSVRRALGKTNEAPLEGPVSALPTAAERAVGER